MRISCQAPGLKTFRVVRIQPNVLPKTSSLKPTNIVFPDRIAGARKFPVGPSIASTASRLTRSFMENSLTFLPFATINLDTDLSSSRASDACSLRLAGMVSPTSILFASKNLDAFVQVVQPLR